MVILKRGVIRMDDELVSVIVPVYNSEKYIKDAIESVLNQTYKNWEMIMVNDCSTDHSKEIIARYVALDQRIKCYDLEENSGAAAARNRAIELAAGRFLAFLDADDIWVSDKLEYQIHYMLQNGYAFTFADYELINDNGDSLEKTIIMPTSISYDEYLANTIIQTVTVVLDRQYIRDVKIPLLTRGHEDFAAWLAILKDNNIAHGINKSLGKYRRTPGSLSSNKFRSAGKTWYVYREVEKLGRIKALKCLVSYAFFAVKKRIYIRHIFNKLKRVFD
jgi:teichuronic acid biosynthesis glycosyltransferase TuaG